MAKRCGAPTSKVPPGVHLVSALSHHMGLTLAQQAVAAKTNAITQVETV